MGGFFGFAMSGNFPIRVSERPARLGRHRRFLASAISAGAHILVAAALIWPRAGTPSSEIRLPPWPIVVSLTDLPNPEPPGSTKAMEVEAQGQDNAVRLASPLPPAPATPAPVAVITQAVNDADTLSEAEIAGTIGAGEEGADGRGGGCNTAGLVQEALRRDPLVRKSVEDSGRWGKAIRLWDGDWVQAGGQDGKGLSVVREAVIWEVAFAPQACRNRRMHGMVLLSLPDGGTRFAIGADDWRWSDLLGLPPER
jgi:hypothetical protein